MTDLIQINTTDDGTEELPYSPAPGETVTILLPCSQPEYYDEDPVGVLELTPETADELLTKMDAIAALPGELPAYVSYWDYTVEFKSIHPDPEDYDGDAIQSALWDGNYIVPTAEQFARLFPESRENIRSTYEKLEVDPGFKGQGPERTSLWWSMIVKHTDITVDTHAIDRGLLEQVAGVVTP